ncbi:DNA-formamidopyrimidine glycosylase family protein [Paraliomyxa miuraensis]|uniref:DNA-formamidopyrimidine glycosylase family protein n=1 Tax=Paraliomyxa miuraensis TaxID=376150 RepID=UPI00225C3CF6|nr:DNA-formamidopyrimidine glycosylase family protein [Paraliomyxa miuraensis]MCX4242978.1 formamidopyrimidine-DNA glycosylase [Paraliomyxa miuraensis]
MPELPDITIYVECLRRLVVGDVLQKLELRSPFVLRTALPPWQDAQGRRVVGVERLAKRIVIELEDELLLVLHLMRLGRLQWLPAGSSKKGPGGKALLARFVLEAGTLVMTEQGTKKRASLHLVQGRAGLGAHDRGGLEVMGCSLEAFTEALTQGNHTLKRALTDPRRLAGIGNAYSDEILHAARLSPVVLTGRLEPEAIERLWRATQEVLAGFTARIRDEVGDGFPAKVTAFREDMAVHGRFGQPCPVCQAPVQRIVYADRETNYCAGCQTGGRRLADRAMSRLLGKDWPRDLDALEDGRSGGSSS